MKALGNQLGRFVLVFNCDEKFDFQAMGRIFVGLCQVGAWGCFDEFNRLEERMLSAVSQQIQTIQVALKEGPKEAGIYLWRPVSIGKSIRLWRGMFKLTKVHLGFFETFPNMVTSLLAEIAYSSPVHMVSTMMS